jgi:zinc transporter
LALNRGDRCASNDPGSKFNVNQVAAEPPGLVGAFSWTAGRPPAPLQADNITSALRQEGWVWLHFDLVDQRAPTWIVDTCGLPTSIQSLLALHDDGLALGCDGSVVHGILADLQSEFAHGSDKIGRLHFAVTDRLLITGRRHPLDAVERVRSALSELRPATAFDVFEAIIQAFCVTISGKLAAATKSLDEVEDHVVAERLSDERKQLKEVRRLAVTLHRPVGTLVALFDEDRRSNWPLSTSGHRVLEHLARRLANLDREIMTINDRARLLQEEIAAELADESNTSLRVLSVITALLLPGTLVVGIFGMNTAGLPFTGSPGGFWLAMLIGAGATVLFYWLIRRAGAKMRF